MPLHRSPGPRRQPWTAPAPPGLPPRHSACGSGVPGGPGCEGWQVAHRPLGPAPTPPERWPQQPPAPVAMPQPGRRAQRPACLRPPPAACPNPMPWPPPPRWPCWRRWPGNGKRGGLSPDKAAGHAPGPEDDDDRAQGHARLRGMAGKKCRLRRSLFRVCYFFGSCRKPACPAATTGRWAQGGWPLRRAQAGGGRCLHIALRLACAQAGLGVPPAGGRKGRAPAARRGKGQKRRPGSGKRGGLYRMRLLARGRARR